MNAQQIAKAGVIVDDEYSEFSIVWHMPLWFPAYSSTGKSF